MSRIRYWGATGGALVLALAMVPVAASAEPWDGNNVSYGPGNWKMQRAPFSLTDVDLVAADSQVGTTDLWDEFGHTLITSASEEIAETALGCAQRQDVDVSTDPDSGDLIISCQSTRNSFPTGLNVRAEIRILQGGEIIRLATFFENDTTADFDIDRVVYRNQFGQSRGMLNYDKQDDSVLAAPTGVGNHTAALNEVGARWIVNQAFAAAPGSIIIGNDTEGVLVPATWALVDPKRYNVEVGAFTIPPGETYATAFFGTWHPQSLIDGGYDFFGADPQTPSDASALEVLAALSVFDSFSGSIAAGLDDVTVVNWAAAPVPGPESEPEPESESESELTPELEAESLGPDAQEPELARTGGLSGGTWALGVGALMLASGWLLLTRRSRQWASNG